MHLFSSGRIKSDSMMDMMDKKFRQSRKILRNMYATVNKTTKAIIHEHILAPIATWEKNTSQNKLSQNKLSQN